MGYLLKEGLIHVWNYVKQYFTKRKASFEQEDQFKRNSKSFRFSGVRSID